MGDEAKNLAAFDRSDALIFLKFTGWRKSGGRIAAEVSGGVLFAVAVGFIRAAETAGAETLQAALVDGRTGDVLWINEASEVYFNPFPPTFRRGALNDLIGDLFKNFPN
ncbi:MAG: hypothetical protein ACU833_11555 [Gammaproteobacteria bacterium]